MQQWEEKFAAKIVEVASADDPAHDFLHFKRVVALAKKISKEENGRMEIVVPAAWLHDLVNVPKDSPWRSQASRLSAEKAIDFLNAIRYPEEFYNDIAHAIEGHSFSANISVHSLEAKIVQDADRLDGLGAIGLARCFAVAGMLKRPFYSEQDPFCMVRVADDSQFTIDHFYKKLFKTAEALKTESGRKEGHHRVQIMKQFLQDLKSEIEI